MFGDERASPKQISLFLVCLQCQGWAVSKTTKLETHVRMCSHPTSDFCKSRNCHTSNFSKIGQSDREIRRWGGGERIRAHVQRCHPTHDLWKARTWWTWKWPYVNVNRVAPGQEVNEVFKKQQINFLRVFIVKITHLCSCVIDGPKCVKKQTPDSWLDTG